MAVWICWGLGLHTEHLFIWKPCSS